MTGFRQQETSLCIHFGAGITQTGFEKIQLLSYSNVPVTHFNQFNFFEQILAGIFGKKRSILSNKNNNNLFDVFFIGIFFLRKVKSRVA